MVINVMFARVSQIECDNSGRPPSTECLQYYTGDSGTFQVPREILQFQRKPEGKTKCLHFTCFSQSWNYDGSTVHYTTEGQVFTNDLQFTIKDKKEKFRIMGFASAARRVFVESNMFRQMSR